MATDLTDEYETVLSLFEEHDGPLTIDELSAITDIDEEHVRSVVEVLEKDGEIEAQPALYQRAE